MTAPQVNVETYSSREYTCSLTLPSIAYGIWEIAGAQSIVTGADSHSIQFVGTRAEVNADLVAVDYVPAADLVTSPFNVTYVQSDDATAHVVNGTMEMTIGTTHAEHSITGAQTYNTDTTATWNMGSITDLRPDNIDSNIQYTMTADNIKGRFTNWDNVGNSTTNYYDQGLYGISGNGNTIVANDNTYDYQVPSFPYLLSGGITINSDSRLNFKDISSDGLTIMYSDGSDSRTNELTGTIDPTASTAVVGVGTLFTSEVQVGNTLIVDGQLRVVGAITDDTNLTVTIAFTDGPNDTTPQVKKLSTGGLGIYNRAGDEWAEQFTLFGSEQYDKTGSIVALSADGRTFAHVNDITLTTCDVYIRNDDITITGSIDPDGTTAVVGVGTLFTSELQVGDDILVNGEIRKVSAITDDTNLTVNTAFTDGANDSSLKKADYNWTLEQSFAITAADAISISDDGDTIVTSDIVSTTYNVLTGTSSVNEGSTSVTGSGTLYTTEFAVDDYIQLGSYVTQQIQSINSNTSLTLYYPWYTGYGNEVGETTEKHTVDGGARSYTRTAGVWSLENEISDVGGLIDVSGDGSTCIVGNSNHGSKINTQPHDGVVYLYTRSGSVWTEQLQIPSYSGQGEGIGAYNVLINSGGDVIIFYVNTTYHTYKKNINGGWDHHCTVPSGGSTYAMLTDNGDKFLRDATNDDYITVISDNSTSTFTDTKANCNTELASVEFVPNIGYNGDFDITYSQNQDTDSVDQSSQVINITNVP